MNSKTAFAPQVAESATPSEALRQPLRNDPRQPLPSSAGAAGGRHEAYNSCLVPVAQSGTQQHPVAELQLLQVILRPGRSTRQSSSLCNIAKKVFQPSEANLPACESAIFLNFFDRAEEYLHQFDRLPKHPIGIAPRSLKNNAFFSFSMASTRERKAPERRPDGAGNLEESPAGNGSSRHRSASPTRLLSWPPRRRTYRPAPSH